MDDLAKLLPSYTRQHFIDFLSHCFGGMKDPSFDKRCILLFRKKILNRLILACDRLVDKLKRELMKVASQDAPRVPSRIDNED